MPETEPVQAISNVLFKIVAEAHHHPRKTLAPGFLYISSKALPKTPRDDEPPISITFYLTMRNRNQYILQYLLLDTIYFSYQKSNDAEGYFLLPYQETKRTAPDSI